MTKIVTRPSEKPPGGLDVELELIGLPASVHTTIYVIPMATLIPPRIFLDQYSITFTSPRRAPPEAIFKPRGGGIPYLTSPQWVRGTPILPCSINDVMFKGLVDTGAYTNTISQETAHTVVIEWFPRGRKIYDDRFGYAQGYNCPLSIEGVGTFPTIVYVAGREEDIIGGEILLHNGYNITFHQDSCQFDFTGV
jgi:hypothetical protein